MDRRADSTKHGANGIKVTCAESRRASVSPTAPRIDVGTNPTAEQVKDAISRAAALSLSDGVPVYIEY